MDTEIQTLKAMALLCILQTATESGKNIAPSVTVSCSYLIEWMELKLELNVLDKRS